MIFLTPYKFSKHILCFLYAPLLSRFWICVRSNSCFTVLTTEILHQFKKTGNAYFVMDSLHRTATPNYCNFKTIIITFGVLRLSTVRHVNVRNTKQRAQQQQQQQQVNSFQYIINNQRTVKAIFFQQNWSIIHSKPYFWIINNYPDRYTYTSYMNVTPPHLDDELTVFSLKCTIFNWRYLVKINNINVDEWISVCVHCKIIFTLWRWKCVCCVLTNESKEWEVSTKVVTSCQDAWILWWPFYCDLPLPLFMATKSWGPKRIYIYINNTIKMLTFHGA
jgi:hypothetical protein